MPQKRKSRSKKKTSGKKGTRKISGANGAIEPSSGSENSSLDLKRKAISVPDEYRVPVTSGQLSGDAQGLSQIAGQRTRTGIGSENRPGFMAKRPATSSLQFNCGDFLQVG
jgi:hypothetical protein